MYSIRVNADTNQLLVALSGRLSTNEALRAVSQAFTLAEAGNILAISCDTTQLRRGPAGVVLVGTALAARYRPGMRIAFIGEGLHRAFAERVARFSGIAATGISAFESTADARAWLAPVLQRTPRLSGTELRHVESLTREPRQRAATTTPSAGRAEPAA